MTDSELIEHMHARGWNVGTIDVPMIREACKALAGEQNPWRQAVDEALIAHALDCTGPGDDPKEKVKELIEWAVTIATDPRVSETAAREQEASATGAEPAGFLAYQGAVPVFYPSMSILSVETKRWNPPVSKIVPLYATPTTSTTGKVDVSRVRAPDIPPGCEMARGWCVQVSVYGETIVTIEEQALSGLADIEPWASTIRGCAEHLQAFIGPAGGGASFDPDAPLETGEADAKEPHPCAHGCRHALNGEGLAPQCIVGCRRAMKEGIKK